MDERETEEQGGAYTMARTFLRQPFPTLGARLIREARQHVSCKLPVFPWLRPLEATIEHLNTLPVPTQQRFQRIDSEPSGFPSAVRPSRNEQLQMPSLTNWMASNADDQALAPYRQGLVGHGTIPVGVSRAATFEPPAQDFTGKGSEQMPISGNVENQASANWGAEHKRPTIKLHPSSLVRSTQMKGSSTQAQSPEAISTGALLSPHLRQRVQDFVGMGTEQMRIHDDAESHALAQAHNADAVTIGQEVFFAQHRFRPQDEDGFALLTHEALHVVQALHPHSTWRRSTQAGMQEEEQQALSVESRALAARRNVSWASSSPVGSSGLPLFTQASALPGSSKRVVSQRETNSAESAAAFTGSTPLERPMRAASDRTLENDTPALALPDMHTLKRAVYRDLMRQIKMDQERGG